MAGADEIGDIAIVGAGLAGMTCALAFGPPGNRGTVRTILIGGGLQEGQPADLRALAITRSSKRMFEAMGLWADIAPHAEPLREILVSDQRQGEEEGPALLHWEDHSPSAPSAYFVESYILQRMLSERLGASRHVQVARTNFLRAELCQGWVEIETTQGDHLKVRLLVAADGRESPCRTFAGIETLQQEYTQRSIVATLEHELPHGGRAYERFMPAGPFALLPLTGRRSSIVWTENSTAAGRMLAGSDDRFLVELRKRAGRHLGDIKVIAGPQSYPLSMMIAQSGARHRTALIGDAAHVIHPLAGLGFNLGMRDIAALVEVIMENARLGLDIGGDGTLMQYERRRRFDTVINTAATDLLNRLFSNDMEAVRLFRDLGLRIVDRVPAIKHFLMQEAAGLTGDLPRLMRGEAI